MLDLLNEKSFSEITIQDLVDRAEVSRMAFYRNYHNKAEIIIGYAKQKFAEFSWDNAEDMRCQIFDFFWQNRETIDVLYKAHFQLKLIDFILQSFNYQKSDPAVAAYCKVGVAYTIFGLCDEWYRRGMKENPEAIMKFLESSQNI